MTDPSRGGLRRTVTFRDEQARSGMGRDDKAPRLDFVETPGMRASILWATTEAPLRKGVRNALRRRR